MELAAPLPPEALAGPNFRRHHFAWKAAAAFGLVCLADLFFYCFDAGAVTGIFTLLLLAAVVLTRPAILRSRPARAAALASGFFAFAQLFDPSLGTAAMFWAVASMAALLPGRTFDDGWEWAQRILVQLLFSVSLPLRDWGKWRGACRRYRDRGLAVRLPLLILPVAGSLLFLLLFAWANPLIGRGFDRLDMGVLFEDFSILRLAFWFVVLVYVWSLLRPVTLTDTPDEGNGILSSTRELRLASLILSLFAFNAVFALQNGLDIAFLWSGARLPEGMSYAEYAHRGAYPLILTALLAALFVLATLRPGSKAAASPLLRRLVYLWIAQNIFLVASTILRTLAYVDAYSLTRMRIAALLWMALVALGLLLICIRLWRGRSAAWLINANLAAASLVLGSGAVVDYGATVAAWNVRQTRLDFCYLAGLGHSALLPLVELDAERLPNLLGNRIRSMRVTALENLRADQGHWRSWTPRGAWRLARAEALIAKNRLPAAADRQEPCYGTVPPPPPEPGRAIPPEPKLSPLIPAPPPPPPAPLTGPEPR